jgi:hypothetical protein
MEIISAALKANMDVIFFIYGFAFVIMGLAIFLQSKNNDLFKISNLLWLLAGFGFLHGANEWIDMWVILRGKSEILDYIRGTCLILSFSFLLSFGVETILLYSSIKHKKLIKLLPLIISIIVLVIGIVSNDFWRYVNLSSRYFLGFPGGILTGIGFHMFYKQQKYIFNNLSLNKYFTGIIIVSILYGIFGGLVVPQADFFPANTINITTFLNIVGLPVQIIRTICAIIFGWSMIGILTIFNWEKETQLKEILKRVTESESKLKLTVVELEKKEKKLIEYRDHLEKVLSINSREKLKSKV